jgi:23S rRNA (guanine745-N1)-methyltransferase
MTSLPPRARPGHGLLRCPICRLDLIEAKGTLVCPNRHGFDIARSGYVNLLGGRRRLPAAGGDSAIQLRHRAAFLDAGHYDALCAMIARHMQHDTAPANHCWCVLDAGCGTGHHLNGISAGLRTPAVGLGLDISSEAGRYAARRWPSLAFATVDLWREWPIRDAAVDLVVSVVAPKNFAETARVLRPGGWLAMAYPGPEHLVELRQRFGLMRQHEAKGRRYEEAVASLIGPPTAARLLERTLLTPTSIRDAVLMGPNAHRIVEASFEADPRPMLVTFDIVLLFARKPNPS